MRKLRCCFWMTLDLYKTHHEKFFDIKHRRKALSASLSKAIPPEQLEPKDHQRRGAEGRGDDDPKRSECLIPARRQLRELRLHEVEFVHDLREIIARLGGLPESEPALGIVGEVAHTACIVVGTTTRSSPILLNTRLPGITATRQTRISAPPTADFRPLVNDPMFEP
jgi:hypothetical protein